MSDPNMGKYIHKKLRIWKRSHPRRENVMLIEALRKLKLRFFQDIEIDNPLFTDRAGNVKGGHQYVDFIVRGWDKKLLGIEFYPEWPNKRPNTYHKNWMNEKKSYLEKRGIPTLIVKRGLSSQEYWTQIYIFLHTLKRRG